MSTFKGRLKEEGMDFIVIDEFQTSNHNGHSFFLSHFHSDHFKGLFTSGFIKELKKPDKYLFCSELTKTLILSKASAMEDEFFFPINVLMEKIEILSVNSPKVVSHEGKEDVVVTSIPAGHCPGSVMFLFEQGSKRILYTGDFRVNSNDIARIAALHHENGEVKKLTNLYLDTTFCHRRFPSFPSRDQCVEDITDIITSWLNTDTSHKVGILYNSFHGSEFLLYELYKRLKIQIEIRDKATHSNFASIPEISTAVTASPSRIHLCPVNTNNKNPCSKCMDGPCNTKIIKPCAMSFNVDQMELGRVKVNNDGIVRVCYSLHSSLEELAGVVNYLQPSAVHPCVIPSDLTSQQVVDNLKFGISALKEKLKEENKSMDSSVKKAVHTKEVVEKYSRIPTTTRPFHTSSRTTMSDISGALNISSQRSKDHTLVPAVQFVEEEANESPPF